jgi:hypothetical protein
MNFKEWFNVNPIRDKLSEYSLTETELKILTPIVVDADFLLEAKKYYNELNRKFKYYMIPVFLLRQFAVNYNYKFYSIFSYYDIEQELNYLTKHIPIATALNAKFDTITSDYEAILKEFVHFYKGKLQNKHKELIKVVLKDSTTIGFKVPQKRP